jgi:hypothetical protein
VIATTVNVVVVVAAVVVVVAAAVVAAIATSNNNSYPASTKQTINYHISRSKVINTFAVIYTCEEYCAVFNNVRPWLMKSWTLVFKESHSRYQNE